MIPKIIHYCWFGNKPKSKLIKKCINSWKKNCPDYKIIEWNESNFNIEDNEFTKLAYEKKMWAFVSDYARLWIIYNYGGIYLDTDVEIIKRIDDVIENKVFFATEEDSYIATGLGFGAEKGNRIIKELMEDYNQIDYYSINGDFIPQPCPIKNTKVLLKLFPDIGEFDDNYENSEIRIYAKDFFCPYNKFTHKLAITSNTIGIHWYMGSWVDWKTKSKIFFKNVAKRILGDKIINNIKTNINKKNIM